LEFLLSNYDVHITLREAKATTEKYLSQLEGIGIMTAKKVGKEIIYINIDLFNLLSET